MKEFLEADLYVEPFPLMVVQNFYNKIELELIWKELDFYTSPNKLFEAKEYGGVVDRTNAKAICLDELYKGQENKKNFRNISNILTVNRKLFNSGVLDKFSQLHECCTLATKSNHDVTKVRYYHNNEYYDPHTDKSVMFLAFSYFFKEPKKFTGGDLIFPKYDFKVPCDNNTMVIFPGWVEHGVRKVTIKDSDYFDGWGRYCISSFFGCRDRSFFEDTND
tara:strand:- start:1920 stop:2579 length:660 start_codon:yes stop_codon:yes gene_type:complete